LRKQLKPALDLAFGDTGQFIELSPADDHSSRGLKGLRMNTGKALAHAGKVPAVTLGFWIIKILATTLGETGGDTLSMSWHLGYAQSTLIFACLFIALVSAQILTGRYSPALYWAVIVATTLTGTTIADFCDRSLGIGYVGGSALLFACVLLSLAAWRLAIGRISFGAFASRREEAFYWLTILASNTLGTALGDLTSDDSGMGYLGSAAFFMALLVILAALYWRRALAPVLLFWSAFVLTRPLGATLGDFLTKPVAHGGLDLSRPLASAALAMVIALGIAAFARAPRRPAMA
jgi:uncharacterized membrane-anchored protein